MRVSVNGENRELHVYDRSTGVDYAKQILCSQEQLVTDMYGEFVLTEEEYNHWTELLAIQQESEDLLFELKDVLVKQELDDYAIKLVKNSGKNGLELAALGNGMHRKYGDFKVKDYGYSTFSKFVQSISQLEIRENKINNKVVFIRQA